MKYMLLMNHIQTPATAPATEWTSEDAKASGEAMGAIHQELTERGEFVGAEGLTGPDAAKIVTFDGAGAPVVTDGPFPESKEFLAGYWLIDVESEARAIEIAARTSAAPGPGGAPTAREIQVRPVMVRPDMQP
ncbi:YciI family protein [Lapillicoccus sp.]|uniref:YciI family protein n=1 Tax=Lapillicoccus sp. TaxID=1909287 RepID=UPI0039831A99